MKEIKIIKGTVSFDKGNDKNLRAVGEEFDFDFE